MRLRLHFLYNGSPDRVYILSHICDCFNVETWIFHVNVTISLITIAHLIQTDNVFSKLAHVRISFLKDNRESRKHH